MSRTNYLLMIGGVLCVLAVAGLAGCKGGADSAAPSPAAERQGLESRLKVIDADLAAIKANSAMDATQKAAAVAQLESQRAAAQSALAKIPTAPVN